MNPEPELRYSRSYTLPHLLHKKITAMARKETGGNRAQAIQMLVEEAFAARDDVPTQEPTP